MIENIFNFTNCFLIAVAITSAFFDIKFRRVPNWITFGVFFFMLGLSLITLKLNIILNCLGGFFIGIILLIIPFALGGMGAGDVKLLGAIGSIVGIKGIINIFFYTAFIGLITGLIYFIKRPDRLKYFLITKQPLIESDSKQKIPYAVVILIGVLIYIYFGELIWL